MIRGILYLIAFSLVIASLGNFSSTPLMSIGGFFGAAVAIALANLPLIIDYFSESAHRKRHAPSLTLKSNTARIERIKNNPIILDIARTHSSAVAFSFLVPHHGFKSNALYIYYDTYTTKSFDFTQHNYMVDSLDTEHCILEVLRSLLPQPETYHIERVYYRDPDKGNGFYYYTMYTTRFDTEHRYWNAKAYDWSTRNLKTF